MGITENSVIPSSGYDVSRANFNDAILVPDFVAKVCNSKPSGRVRIWQLYNIFSGLQEYKKLTGKPWEVFTPNFTSEKRNQVVFETGTRLKGFVPISAPEFSNVSFWQVFNQYLNPLLNEMYTCLRVDSFNRIKPTVVIREQPLSTGLFNHLVTSDNKLEQLKTKTKEKKSILSNSKETQVEVKPDSFNRKSYDELVKGLSSDLKKRAMYGNLPRWQIDESILLGLNMSTNEASRVNFVQVWSESLNSYNPSLTSGDKNELADSEQNNLQIWKQAQLALGNYIIDNNDITRNGLRAAIFNTDFDLKTGTGNNSSVVTLAPFWAKIKADHLFNGHLKPVVSLECAGISAPICEGDNLEVRGVVFHIQSVNHSVSISPSGVKTFRTSLIGDNGIMAYSLENDKQVPVYPSHTDNIKKVDEQSFLGVSDFEIQRDRK